MFWLKNSWVQFAFFFIGFWALWQALHWHYVGEARGTTTGFVDAVMVGAVDSAASYWWPQMSLALAQRRTVAIREDLAAQGLLKLKPELGSEFVPSRSERIAVFTFSPREGEYIHLRVHAFKDDGDWHVTGAEILELFHWPPIEDSAS